MTDMEINSVNARKIKSLIKNSTITAITKDIIAPKTLSQIVPMEVDDLISLHDTSDNIISAVPANSHPIHDDLIGISFDDFVSALQNDKDK